MKIESKAKREREREREVLENAIFVVDRDGVRNGDRGIGIGIGF